VNQAIPIYKGRPNRDDQGVWDEGGKGIEESRQMVRGRESNKAKVHETVPDGLSDATSRAPNHALFPLSNTYFAYP
jgi:Na+/H+-translocating membrane pyrophosphatase